MPDAAYYEQVKQAVVFRMQDKISVSSAIWF